MPKKKIDRNRKLEKTLRVFCEGEKTEPDYLREFIRHNRNNNRASVVNCSKNTPVQLIDAAIAYKTSARAVQGDEYWVVYDREAENKYARELHLKAWEKAQNNAINVALSNVCFEYWLLLHLVDSSAPYSSFSDLKNNSCLLTRLKADFGIDYEKSSSMIFAELKENVQSAIERAERINEQSRAAAGQNDMPFDLNPFTDLPKLLQAIRQF